MTLTPMIIVQLYDVVPIISQVTMSLDIKNILFKYIKNKLSERLSEGL